METSLRSVVSVNSGRLGVLRAGLSAISAFLLISFGAAIFAAPWIWSAPLAAAMLTAVAFVRVPAPDPMPRVA
jgi:hypothetical protein